jgi:hypothetical protein
VRETQHEKIIRGLAVGVGFIYYGRFYADFHRIPFFGMARFTRWLWLTLVPPTTTPSDDSSTSPFPTRLMTFDGQQ